MAKHLNWLCMQVKAIKAIMAKAVMFRVIMDRAVMVRAIIVRAIISHGLSVISLIFITVAPSQVFAASSALIDPTLPSMDVGVNAEGVNIDAMAEPVLQSVLLSSSRKLAVISGNIYKVGDKVGEARLIKLNEHEALLRQSDGSLQTLNMHNGLIKKVIVESPARGTVKHKIKRAIPRTGQTQ